MTRGLTKASLSEIGKNVIKTFICAPSMHISLCQLLAQMALLQVLGICS